MCSVSVISDYYRDRTIGPSVWPPPVNTAPIVVVPQPGMLQAYLPPIPQWDEETKKLLREVLERLDKIDKRLGDIECHDESKDEIKHRLGLL